jgi:hypothetical protein
LTLALLPWTATSAADAPPVHAKKLAEGRYELTVTVSGTTDPRAALPILMPEAVRLCGNLQPTLGKYRFDATEPMPGSKSAKAVSVTLVQSIDCGGGAAAVGQPDTTALAATVQGVRDDRVIRTRTLAYLAAKDRGDYAAAHAMLAPNTQALMTRGTWFESRIAFNTVAGTPNQREVIRITWYDNPPDVEPGLYAAADYRASYSSGAFYCGFVGWRQEPDGSYRIVREEEGHITPADARKLDAGKMVQARKQLGCRD